MTTVTLNTATRKVEVFSSARDRQARADIADLQANKQDRAAALDTLSDSTAFFLSLSDDGDAAGARSTLGADDAANLTTGELDDDRLSDNVVVAILSELTVNIPSDYATLQAAIDALSHRPNKRGARIILNIESGHQPESGVDVSDGFYGHFWITSDDALVTVGAGYTGSFIAGINCHLPVLDCKIDADGKGGTAYDAARACTGYVTSGSGVINSGGHGAQVRASTVYALGTVWDGAVQSGIRIMQGASATFQGATANGCGVFGSSISSVYVSRGSTLNFSSGTANNARGTAIRVRRSFFGSFDVTVENATEVGVWADHGSTITLAQSSVTGSGTDDLHVSLGGTIHASNTPTTNSGGTQPILGDTNVEAFNLWTANGCITQENAPIGAYYTGNVVGTVSESSGTPTGAVVEQGSNANGEYIRWADGTQMCWSPTFTVNSTTASGNGFHSSTETWTFPAEFSATPNCTAGNIGNSVSHWAAIRPLNATSARVNAHSWTSLSGRQINAMAVGRWF